MSCKIPAGFHLTPIITCMFYCDHQKRVMSLFEIPVLVLKHMVHYLDLRLQCELFFKSS